MPRAFWSRLFTRRRARPATPRVPRSFRPRLEGLEDRTLLSAGDLDPTFGTGGKVLTGFTGSLNDTASAVVREPDGKYVVAGTSSGSAGFSLALARYAAAGTLDPSFGTGGRVLTHYAGELVTVAEAAVQGDGKLVIAGTVSHGTGTNFTSDFLVLRYNPDGTPDTTFGSGGTVRTDFDGGTDSLATLLVQPDGKLVAVGHSQTASSDDAALARCNPDGSPDISFGTAGKVFLSGPDNVPADAALQSDGKIVVAGSVPEGAPHSSPRDFSLRRFNADGSLDVTFGSGGQVTTNFGAGQTDVARAVAVQSDGKIVVAGDTRTPNVQGTASGPGDFALARFNADGTLDATFGTGGKVTTDIGSNSDDTVSDLALQPDGRIAVAGSTPSFSQQEVELARYNADGSLDLTFGTAGKFQPQLTGRPRLLLDGGAIVFTFTLFSPDDRTDDFGLARLTPLGVPDATFGTAGQVTTDFVGPVNAHAADVARQSDGKLVVVGGVFVDRPYWVVARYNPDGSPDTSFAQGGTFRSDFGFLFGADAGAVVIQPDGKIVVAGTIAWNIGLARFNADGSLDTTFGRNGLVLTGSPSESSWVFDMALQPDGKILVGGAEQVMGDRFGLSPGVLMRFTADGAGDGSAQLDQGGVSLSSVIGVASQPDGKILATGYPLIPFSSQPRPLTVVRLNPDLTVDSGFGTNGQATLNVSAGGQAVAVRPDGRIVIVATLNSPQPMNGLAAARLLPGGAADASFGAAGVAATNLGTAPPVPTDLRFTRAAGLALQPNGLIAAGGQAGSNGGDFALAVYLPDGSLDPRFGQGGIVTTDFSGMADFLASLLQQPDGKLLAAGTATVDGVLEFALARYEGDTAPPVAPTSENIRFVTDRYQDLLGRASDAAGLAANTQPLDAARAQTFGDLARGFVGSAERRSAVIAGYYTTYLGRAADAGGVQNWLGLLQRGATPEQVLATILGSEEYFQKAGGTNAASLDRLYRDVLGRDRDPGAQGFLDALNGGQVTRPQVAFGLLASAEYRTRFVGQLYQEFLGRQPGVDEVRPWLQLLAQPSAGPGQLAPSEQVLAGILVSAEYLGNNGNTSQTWLDSLYRRLLNRLPDAPGYSAALQMLVNATAGLRLTEAQGIVSSDEFRRKTVVDDYTRFLHRTAGAGETDFWAAALEHGAAHEQVLALLVGSDEYFREVGSTNQSWLDQVYRDLLGRDRDPGSQGFLDALNGSQATRVQVATAILGSAEYRRLLVQSYYTTYLGRPTSDAELAVWVAALQRGDRQEQVLANIVASAEYFSQAGQRR
jgi:uncharacterized delta-60 repeat protein